MDNKPSLGRVQIVGMPWFSREDYDAFRRVMPDRAWHATFDEWEFAANQTLRQIESQDGIRVVEAHVRSHAFVQWCRDTGVAVDSAALVEYANEFAARKLLQESTH